MTRHEDAMEELMQRGVDPLVHRRKVLTKAVTSRTARLEKGKGLDGQPLSEQDRNTLEKDRAGFEKLLADVETELRRLAENA